MITLAIDYNSQLRKRRSWSAKANAGCWNFARRVTLLPKTALVAIFVREIPKTRAGRAAAGYLV